MKERFELRAVQLDLARQMETLDFIKEFIDFISKQGYNALFLYLEARVKTQSFPYPPENESYTPEQMHEIIDYASSKGLDVIPGLACLGHAELFLQYEELNEIAELGDGRNGRFWNNKKQVFCPSNEKTFDFLEQYLNEICEIFPSKYIHIGCDEVWDIGYCDKCAPKVKDFRGEQQLFLDVIKFCHRILAEKHDRRVMMWDDMFECYPDILDAIPRDIIMVCWQYQFDVQHIKGHFGNLKVEKSFDEYERLGFDYIIAPATGSTANIRTFTEYAEKYKPFGALLTSWENSHSYIYKILPTIAYAGLLWNDSTEKNETDIFAKVIESLFGCCDDALLNLMKCYCESGTLKEGRISKDSLLTIPYSGLNYGMKEQLNFMKITFEQITSKVKTEIGRHICRDISLVCSFHTLKFNLQEIARELFSANPPCPATENELEDIMCKMETLRKIRVKEWEEFRHGINPCKYDSMYRDTIKLIRNLPEDAKTHGKMSVRFCLPDQYSAEYTQISLMYDGKWKQVAAGSFKCLIRGNNESFYHMTFLIDQQDIPEAVRFECQGYGGQGVAYLEIVNDSGRFVPDKIIKVNGKVIEPEFVFDNDCKWCFIGEKNTLAAFKDRALASACHSVEYKLKKSI